MATKKTTTAKKSDAVKVSAAKVAEKKPAKTKALKTAVEKPVKAAEKIKTAVKAAAKKVVEKVVAKKAAEKTAEKKAAVKKAVEKKPVEKKVAEKKPVEKKAAEKKVVAKKAPAKKVVVQTAATRSAPKAYEQTDVLLNATAKKAKVVKASEKVAAVKASAKPVMKTESLAQSYAPEYLVLMQKDPNWMQAFWEVSENRIKSAKKGKGKLVLRLFDISKDLTVKRSKKVKFHDIVVPADAKSWYVEKNSAQNCMATLGVVANGKFEALVEAGPMQTFSVDGSSVDGENVFVRASLGGATMGGFGSSGLSSMSAKTWLENALNGLSSSSGSMFSGALSSAALKSNKLELPKDSVNYGKDFFLWVKTRLIVYGGTRPDAHLQVRGEPFPLNPDGTFSFEEDLPDSTKIIPVFATDKDGDFPTTIVPIVVKRTE
ncbi:MAG: DUF4912 domain-containing protein [Fibrobacter sp.]|nr:DUF4912 domain-containing protein [Fibrobacter sp.]